MRHVSSIDSTALNALRQVIIQSKKHGIIIILSGVSQSVETSLHKAGIIRLVGAENICANIDQALFCAGERMKKEGA